MYLEFRNEYHKLKLDEPILVCICVFRVFRESYTLELYLD